MWMCECGARVVGLMLMLMLTGLIDPDYFRASYLGSYKVSSYLREDVIEPRPRPRNDD